MRARPVRPNIYLPVVRFGVADSDWFSVLLISCAGYLLPIPLGITILYVPLQMWTWLLVTIGSIAFFNYIRIGRKPRWLPYKLRALCLHHRQNRSIPNGKNKPCRDWLSDFADGTNKSDRANRITPATLIETNNVFQEAYEQKWNAQFLTTN